MGQFDFYVPDGITIDKDNVVRGSGLTTHGLAIKTVASGTIAGYTHYQLVITGDTSKPVFTTNEVARIPVALDGAADGILPIIVKSNKTSSTKGAGNRGNYATSSSVIVVGDPADATYAPEGVFTTAVSEGVAALGIKNLDLTKVTSVEGDFFYAVGLHVTAPSTPVNANVKVVAPCAGDYMSLKSPVALPGVACYTYNKVAGDVAYFVEATDVPEGETVIVAGNVEKTVENATLVSVENGSATSGCYISNDGKELRRVNGTVKVPALRGTFDIPAGSNLRIALETPTGIKMIGTADEVFGNTYDLQGRQVENAHNGVYVVNGKKQFVK